MQGHKYKLNRLSLSAINRSPEIREWLSQFSDGQKPIAKTLLSRLIFVSRDEYASWLRHSIEQLNASGMYAFYSVRKLSSDQRSYWDTSGNPVSRPAESQGSEDLIYSLISNMVRSSEGRFFDHPSQHLLKENKIRNYVLIDDSIGSGDRISGFINALLEHPTFLSWWSFGWIRITVLTFARTKESEANILKKIRGSNHSIRKFPKASKVSFISNFVYGEKWYESRWGNNYKQLFELCYHQSKIGKWARLGYGKIFSNLIFYHSVPNNIPGILWFNNEKWKGLMPGRAIPGWLLELLENPVKEESKITSTPLPIEMLNLLKLVKRGVRSTSSIAIRLGIDSQYAENLTSSTIKLGLLTTKMRLTKSGFDLLKESQGRKTLPSWDYSCYIPSSWCAGRSAVQPPAADESHQRLADSIKTLFFMDGDVGETSLERSDAKAATPPFSVTHQSPSASREMRDTDGPLGSKER